MSDDPTEPETFEDEAALDTYDELDELDAETPEADAAEQHAELLQQRDSPISDRHLDSADPADAAEQARVVAPDEEDDYR